MASGFEDLITNASRPNVKVFDLSMTSRQIAEVTDKLHKNVMHDVITMIDRGDIDGRNFALSSYKTSQNKEMPMYDLDFDATMTVITGYDAGRRKAVIIRIVYVLHASLAASHLVEFL